MPEGDTIFRTARALGRALGGKPVTAFRSTFALLSRFDDDAPLAGRTVERVESRGKWLLIHFSGGATLAMHMLMTGAWHIYRHGERWLEPHWKMRIAIENAEFVTVGFNVPVAEMRTTAHLARDPRIPDPALDILGAEFDATAAAARIGAQLGEEIGNVLLDQRVLAGVGNVFKSEVCFVTGVHPFARVGSMSAEEIARVVAASRRLVGSNVLEDSGERIVTYGGRTRRTTRDAAPGASLWVYGRAGEPCLRCGTRVESRMQGKDVRVTFWCPMCQRIACSLPDLL
ncbi:MAG: DNA-formamidopyrimidine glycosylase family protein [Terracidiphilus sp.]